MDIQRLDITKFSDYIVKTLSEDNIEDIFNLCQSNKLFYQYCEAKPTREQIISDLNITPPGKDKSDKYYVGFYSDDELIAVMDLIDGYPKKDIAFIGFFMVDQKYQGKEIGSKIISDLCEYLNSVGFNSVCLGIDKDNPQSNHFWEKNKFEVVKEIEKEKGKILYAKRIL